MDVKVCVLGAGPAGLTAAYALSKQGVPAIVLEADANYVGGISRTVQREGYCVDIGGHRFFSKSKEITALWHEILGAELLLRKRKSRIYYRNKFYPYPLDAWATLRNLGVIESGLCVLSYLKALCFPVRNPQTFEQWVSNQFGKRLFRTFFKTYTEKVWGIPCNKISADWAAQRIRGLSMRTAIKNALGFKQSKVKTLIEEFLYPRKGPGMMWEAAAAQLVANGSEVRMGARVVSLSYDAVLKLWHVTYQDNLDGQLHDVTAAHVISTLPLRELVQQMEHTPHAVREAASKLGYRDFLIVALVVKDRAVFDDQWIYVHTDTVKVGRIQNFKSWSPDMVPNAATTCYGMEYFCFEEDGLWVMSDEDLIALATQELVTLKLADVRDVQSGFVIRQPKAYPVYDQVYTEHVATIRKWLESECPNLQVVGRNGMHKYNNQDHSMMTALLAARNVMAGRMAYDTWQVNQDAEYHESGASTSGERMVPTSA
jgi:protoporphyrinogen oxidase